MREVVSKTKQVLYEEFLNDPEPMSLRREIAVLRTMLIEAREHIEQRHYNRVTGCADKMMAELDAGWDWDEGGGERDKIYSILMRNLVAEFGADSSITLKDAVDFSRIVDTISKVTERAKKIEEGITLKLEWGPGMVEVLQNFIQFVVFPIIPDMENRLVLAHSAQKFFSGSKLSQLHGSGGEVIDLDA